MDGDKRIRVVPRGDRGGQKVRGDPGVPELAHHPIGDFLVHRHLGDRTPPRARVAAQTVLLVGKLVDLPMPGLDPDAPRREHTPDPGNGHGRGGNGRAGNVAPGSGGQASAGPGAQNDTRRGDGANQREPGNCEDAHECAARLHAAKIL